MEHWAPMHWGFRPSICILYSPSVVGYSKRLPPLNVYLGCSLDFFCSVSPRPPCLPPKPQKMRRPRPLSVCSHKLFNGCMKRSLRYLLGSHRVQRAAANVMAASLHLLPRPAALPQPTDRLASDQLKLSIRALGQAV